MSVLTPDMLAEAVRIVNARFSPADPKISFLGLRARLLTEAQKRHAAYIAGHGSACALTCTSDWCAVFLKLLDHPQLLRQDRVIEILANTLDRLERGENRTVALVYKEHTEVFKTL